MPETLDTLDIAEGKRLSVTADGQEMAAVPEVRDADGSWRRAGPGDGVAEALLNLLVQGSMARDRFTVTSWARHNASGERAVGVDQTNESVIVGSKGPAAVVKWATHLQEGPHPAPRRISVLRDAGFVGMPTPWGMVTWRAADGTATLVANVDEYLSGAVDGWTWAVEEITRAVRDRDCDAVVAAAAEVGAVVAQLHAALAGTVTIATPADAMRWRVAAFDALETACASGDSTSSTLLRARHRDVTAILEELGGLAGTPIIEGHGDLHVGQVLRTRGRFVITDFDGNPVLPAEERVLPIPAALDVAGMTQSLVHAAIVARRYTELDAAALAEVDAAGRAAFLAAYAAELTALGHADLYDPRPLYAFRMQQVLREIIYAAQHLPRWMYVPDAALPALLDERTRR